MIKTITTIIAIVILAIAGVCIYKGLTSSESNNAGMIALDASNLAESVTNTFKDGAAIVAAEIQAKSSEVVDTAKEKASVMADTLLNAASAVKNEAVDAATSVVDSAKEKTSKAVESVKADIADATSASK